MPKIKTSTGIEMYYEQSGRGPELILISGLSASCTTWQHVKEKLSSQFHVTVFDNRGVGQTDTPSGPYTIEMMAQDTNALMDALSIPNATIVGHSMGGMILQQMCLEFPKRVSGAIISASAASLTEHAIEYITSVAELWESGAPLDMLIEKTLREFYAYNFLADARRVKEVKESIINTPYPQSLECFKSQFSACKTVALSQKITSIKTPTLIIAGQRDTLLPPYCSEYLHQKILGSRMTIIEDCGHMVQIEKPDVFCTIVEGFRQSSDKGAQ